MVLIFFQFPSNSFSLSQVKNVIKTLLAFITEPIPEPDGVHIVDMAMARRSVINHSDVRLYVKLFSDRRIQTCTRRLQSLFYFLIPQDRFHLSIEIIPSESTIHYNFMRFEISSFTSKHNPFDRSLMHFKRRYFDFI